MGFFESLRILSSHDRVNSLSVENRYARAWAGWGGWAARLAPRIPLPPRQQHGPRRKHSILMRLWSILWVPKCRPPARVAHQGSASLRCCCLKNWVTLCSNRPGGLVVLVRRAAMLPLPREGSCLLIPIERGERHQQWVRGMPASVQMTTSQRSEGSPRAVRGQKVRG